MSTIGQIERATQTRVVKLFQKQLGYSYLGNWEEREGNSNIEEDLLRKFLSEKKQYSETLINKTLFELNKAAGKNDNLYDVNKEVYSLLRYGVKVREEVGENTQTVELIDWKHPQQNDFYIAEKVTVKGEHDKRPDIVLYVNGIALGVLELKRSTISISEGIRQNLDNQDPKFIRQFFTTVQLVMTGSDSEGLRYATIETKEKHYLTWKEETKVENPLDKHLLLLCNLNVYLFSSLNEVRVMAQEWRNDYNHYRPHKALRYMTPMEYRKICEQINQKRVNIFGVALSTPASGNPPNIAALPVVDNAVEQQTTFQQKTLLLN